MTDDDRQFALDLAKAILDTPQPIEGLTPQQSKLVSVLKAARGRVVNKEHLADAIAWDRMAPPLPNIVTVQLHQIRKLRPDVGASLETVLGMGVRWREVQNG